MSKPTIAVLGAGLQGTCVALELAARGRRVDLYDRQSACLTGASLANEGKIHLGYVYANDASRRTARAMTRGALCFAPLMRRWLGPAFDALPVTPPFLYAVSRASLVAVDAIQAHLDDCVAIARDVAQDEGGDYFGRDFRAPARRMKPAEWEATIDSRTVAAVFETCETAIDPEAVAALVRERIAATPEIAPRLGTTVTAVSDLGSGFAVDFTTADGRGREVYDHVVNATWEGRLAIDASLGLRPERPWLWRLRRIARVLTPDASRLVSVTTLLGPFGDVANFGGGALFMSWYPSGRIGISREPAPSAWQPAASTEPGSGEAGLIDGLGAIVPGVATLLRRLDTRVRWLHGAVFAWGSSDIDDPGSYLHRRYEIGVHSHGRYHSIDTSKYTTAPLFALEAADRVCGKD